MKNSPASKSPPSQPPPKLQGGSLMTETHQLRAEKDALSQMLWEAVRAASPETHTLEVPAAVSDPLWLLAFVPGSKEGTAKILAGTMPPISEQEKKRVVRLLRGTSKPIAEALLELKLPYPPKYVEEQIKAHLVWKAGETFPDKSQTTGVWQSVREPGFGERAKNLLKLPKS